MAENKDQFDQGQLHRFKKGVFLQFRKVDFSKTKQFNDEANQLPFILKSMRMEYLF